MEEGDSMSNWPRYTHGPWKVVKDKRGIASSIVGPVLPVAVFSTGGTPVRAVLDVITRAPDMYRIIYGLMSTIGVEHARVVAEAWELISSMEALEKQRREEEQ
jgi:hypothetical protein